VNPYIAIDKARLGWEDQQRAKKKFESQPRDRNASHFPPRNNFRSGFNQPNASYGEGNHQYTSNRSYGGQNQVEASYPHQQPAPGPNTPFAAIVCFACQKVGHKASYYPEKKKNRMSGSTTKSSQASRIADHWRLTHLIGRETRDAPYAMTGEFSH
jgi:hypothetical protein